MCLPLALPLARTVALGLALTLTLSSPNPSPNPSPSPSPSPSPNQVNVEDNTLNLYYIDGVRALAGGNSELAGKEPTLIAVRVRVREGLGLG